MISLWQWQIVRGIGEIAGLHLDIVAWSAESNYPKSESWLFQLWSRFDARVFKNKIPANCDPEMPIDLKKEIGSQQIRQYPQADAATIAKKIAESSSNLIIWLQPGRPPELLVSAATNGIWGICNGFNLAFGFRELVGFENITVCDIVGYGPTVQDDYLVARSYAASDQLSLSRGMVGIRAKCCALLVRAVRSLTLKQGAYVASERGRRLDCGHPTTAEFLWGLSKLYGRYVCDLATRPFWSYRWQLAYRFGGQRLNQEDLKCLRPPHKGFWADPFVTAQNNRVFIYFEEFIETTMRGHIAAIELYADGSEGNPVNVLQRDYHLSYPFLFRFQGQLYMIPESAESHQVEIYRCANFPDQWLSVATILQGVRAYDPTLVFHDDLWWMFVTIQHDGNSANDELHLYYSSNPLGDWVPHPQNPVQLDVRAARPAGALFRENNTLFRPAQDCSLRYGWAISIQEIKRMTTTEYEEITVQRIEPQWAGQARATHTVNQSEGVTVYDFEARCRK
jgi:hypothetical protein